MVFSVAIAALVAATLPPTTPAPSGDQAEAVSGLNAAQMFRAAEQLVAENRRADAEKLLEALSEDPDLAVRNEARFRLAKLREGDGKRAEAAVLLRRILDEEPGAARIRLELARLLLLLGNEMGARQQLRQAQGAGLPPDLARVVDQFRIALRSRAPLGANVEIALAPDGNINRATTQQTLDGGFFPIDLSNDARAQSGTGLALNGQVYGRLPVTQRFSLVPRVSGSTRLYRDSQFNDIGIDARLGVERSDATAGRVTASVGHERRWFGGRPLNRNWLVSLDWLRPVSTSTQITVSASASRQRFPNSAGQNGTLYQTSVGYERALSQQTGLGVSFSAARQHAADPGYANWSGGLTALGYVELGKSTLFVSLTARRLKADAPFFLFVVPRREWLVRSIMGATIRQIQVAGFSPVVRLIAERNRSTVGLFDYRRLAAEIGIERAF